LISYLENIELERSVRRKLAEVLTYEGEEEEILEVLKKRKTETL